MTRKPKDCVDFKLYLRKELDERFRWQCERVGMKRTRLLVSLLEEWILEMEKLERKMEKAARSDP